MGSKSITLVTLAFNILSQVSMFVCLPIFGERYGVEAIGYYGNIVSIGSFLGTIMILRSELSIISNEVEKSKHNIVFSLLFSLVSLLILLAISYFFLSEQYILSVVFSFSFILVVILQSGFNNMKQYHYSGFIKFAISIIFPLIVFIIDLPNMLAFSHITSMLVVVCILSVIYKNSLFNFDELSFRGARAYLFSARRYIKYTFPASVITSSVNYLIPSVVFLLFDEYKAGVFFMLSKIMLAPVSILGMSLGQIIRKELVDIIDCNDRFKKRVRNILLGLLLISVIYVFVNVALLGWVIDNMFGDEWKMIKEYYLYFLILPSTMIVYVPMSQLYLVVNKQNVDFKFQLLNALVLLLISCVTYYCKFELIYFILIYALSMSFQYIISLCYVTYFSLFCSCSK